ncbi:MAG: alpha-ketoacid dehydrogenase subunit beta [Solirubrobacterales bacterium]
MPEASVKQRDPNVSQIVAEAIRDEMARDERILMLGEDIAAIGGTFGASRGLLRQFGESRVRDTPISEMAFTGMAVGLALEGWRPLVEVMFVDFIGVCLEQVYNAIAKNRYMSGGRVSMPVTIKTAGGNIGAAAQHSQSLWGLFAHLPGMHVVAPSCPHDFRGLMAAALRSDDPVVFIEHKDLLLRKQSSFEHGVEVPSEPYVVAIGKAATVREGEDVTLVSLSAGVGHCLTAAATLAERHGVEAEVVDLRSVAPLDHATVAASVARTGALVVVDEDYLSFGLSGELVARVVEELGGGALRAVARHAVPDVPIPAALSLEQAVVPSAASVTAAVLAALGKPGVY